RRPAFPFGTWSLGLTPGSLLSSGLAGLVSASEEAELRISGRMEGSSEEAFPLDITLKAFSASAPVLGAPNNFFAVNPPAIAPPKLLPNSSTLGSPSERYLPP